MAQVGKKRRRQYVVYPNSLLSGVYPDYFRKIRLEYDEFGEDLVFHPHHTIGSNNPVVDLRPWSGCRDILDNLREDGHVIEEVILSGHNECDDHLLALLVPFVSTLSSLSISNCPLITHDGINHITSLQGLRCLDISNNSFLSDQVIHTICCHLIHLTSLNISQCPLLTDHALYSVANTLGSCLRSFICTDNAKITFEGSNELLMRAELIETIDFSRCSSLTFFGIVIETHNKILQYLARHIKVLRIDQCHKMDRVALKYITTALPDLEEFSACFVNNIDDTFLYDLLEGCTHLRHLRVNGCQQISSRAVLIVYKHLPRLETLALGNIVTVNTHDVLANYIAKSTFTHTMADFLVQGQKLRSLDLSHHTHLTDAHFPPSTSVLAIHLTHIHLAYCPQLTSLAFIYFGQYCPNLISLDASGNHHLTDTFLQGLAQSCSKLRRLVLNNCRNLTDTAIRIICKYMKSMQELYASYDDVAVGQEVDKDRPRHRNISSDLSEPDLLTFSPLAGHQYTDRIWHAIFRYGRALKVLVLANQLDITLSHTYLQKVFQAQAQKMRALQSNNNNNNASQEFAREIALDRHYSLIQLDLRGCASIVESSVPTFLTLFPRMLSLSLPNHLIQSSKVLLSSKFVQPLIASLPYVRDYEKSLVEGQVHNIRRSMEINVNTKKALYAGSNNAQQNFLAANKAIPLVLLQPHARYPAWYYRDAFVRRRLLENFSTRVIYLCYIRYKIWSKFKYILMGRRIWSAYRRYKREVKRQKAIQEFIDRRNVRIIERYYYHYRILYRRAAIKIQRRFRHYRRVLYDSRLTLFHKMATLIQKRARGMIVRTSERYVLAQLFLKFPTFWKQIANISASPMIASGATRKIGEAGKDKPVYHRHSTELYEVEDLHNDASEMVFQITHKPNKENGKMITRKLAPKLEQVIPQRFDLSPYVSLSDGRKLSFHSSYMTLFQSTFLSKTKNMRHETLTAQQQRFLSGKYSNNVDERPERHVTTVESLSTHLPIHIYNFKYWPISRRYQTQTFGMAAPTTSNANEDSMDGGGGLLGDDAIFNPQLNNFEVVLNRRYVLYCDKCSHRLRLIHCHVCNQGYCFHCAFHYHNSILTKSHQMDLIEPRLFQRHSVSKSLIYYIQNSQWILYNVQYVYKFLNSQAEVQRLKKEKELIRNYEKEQERLRLIYLQAQEKFKVEFQHANTMILFYKVWKAKRIYKEKQKQREIEFHHERGNRAMNGVEKLQVLIRRFICRMWFYKRSGVLFSSIPKYYYTIPMGGLTKMKSSKLLTDAPQLGRQMTFKGKNGNNTNSNLMVKKIFHKPKKTIALSRTKKAIQRSEVQERCQLDVFRRATYHRQRLLSELEESFTTTIQFIQTNTAFWKKEFMSLHPQAIRFRALRDECHNEYKKFQIQLSQQQAETHAHGSNGTARSHNHKHKDKDALPAPLKPQMSSNFASSTQKKGPPVLDPEEQQKKVMQLKVENLSQRVETLDNIQWWIRQILRTAFRKKKILESSYQDLQERLRFVSLEYYRLDRILLFVDARISDGARNSKRSGKGSSEQLTLKGNEGTSNAETKESNSDRDSLKGEAGSKEKDEELAKMQKLMDGSKVDNSLDWLAVYREFIINQLVLLDGQQESLLKEEIVKIQKEEKEMQILHSLLAELIQSLQVNIQLCAERMSLEKRLVMLPYGSEEAIQCNEQLILLKNKQKILTNQSIDSLKLTLQDVLDGFDKKILELYAFPNDHPDLSIDDMSDLQIVPLEPYSAPKAIAFEEFVMIYFLQPWLVNQCIEDIRYEERINHKLIRYQAYQEEHHNYQDQVKDGSQQVTTLMEECKEIETQILARMDPDEDESEGERIQRETQLNVFRAEIEMKNVAITVAKKQIEQATIAMKPILHNMAEVIQEVQQVKKQLADRLAARDENIRNFFKGEEALISAHVQQLEKDVHQLEDAHALLQQKQEVVQRSVEAFDALQLDGKVNEAGYRYLPPFIKVPPSSLELQALYHTTKPDLYPNATDHVLAKLKGRLATFTSQSATYQQMMEVLAAEKKFLLSFSQQKSIFQSYVQLFIAELQIARRQRALDLDLNVRSKNLDSFRASRLQSLQEIKQKQLAEELEAQRILEEKLKNRQSTLKKVVKNTIKATRQLKKAVNQAIAPDLMEMDDEERKMMANIRERNKEGLGARPECIKSLHFTFNSSEYHYFQKQNLHLAAKGLPYFKPMERSLGNQIFIWMQHTYDDSIFITDIYLSHRQPDNEYHRVFTGKNAYDEVIRNETSELEIYMKRDKLKSKGICNLHLAYTEKDESEFIMNGYTKLEPNLEAFGMPNMTLWAQYQDKLKVSQLTNTNALIAEITKVRHLLSEQPNNRNLLSLLQRLNERLKDAHEKEVANQVTDPLQYAIELLALDEAELQDFAKVFASIDEQKNGVVSLEQIMKFLKQPLTPLSREVFVSVDAMDNRGYIEFGDFARAVGTYCFFGKEEILRFIYIFADSDRTGSIKASEFTHLIEMINPLEKVRTRRAMKEMNLSANHTIGFDDFKRLNEQFPSLFLPAFLLQNAMRTMVMGVDWWFQKLTKYKGVRDKMASEGLYAEAAVTRELERFETEQQRLKRVAERSKEIEKETNDFKKVVLQAQQFWDEVREDTG